MNSKKYVIFENQIMNIKTAKLIPENEPIFILRAKDENAIRVLNTYLSSVLYDKNYEFTKEVIDVIKDFEKFAKENKSLMKLPD